MQKHEKQSMSQADKAQLNNRAQELRKEIFLLRMKKFSSPEKNTALTKVLRKDLARVLTAIKQRELHDNNS